MEDPPPVQDSPSAGSQPQLPLPVAAGRAIVGPLSTSATVARLSSVMDTEAAGGAPTPAPLTSDRLFDLNMQRVLEHWTVSEALREIIANALDEQALTHTDEPQVARTGDGVWHIRDFGRGLRYDHFTQNEDPEKLRKPRLVIGKFGVGLKDAIATFDRHEIGVAIHSRHAEITTVSAAKHGFDDVRTLHAVVAPPSDPQMTGTEFVLSRLSDEEVEKAKSFFLRYSDDIELEATRYGSVLQRESGAARIYVNGLRVAEEPNFLFSYNITSLTKGLRAALNRERSNVGRQAYSDRVKAILLASSAPAVADPLAEDLANFIGGKNHDETAWLDVGIHACKVLNAHQQVVFVTAEQMYLAGGLIARAGDDGFRVIVVPDTVAQRLPRLTDIEGNAVRDLNEYRDEWNRSFEYDFVAVEELTAREQAVFARAAPLLELLRKETKRVREILVSRTMRLNAYSDNEAVGVWDSNEGRIIIKRDQLARTESFLSTLLHEVGHALSGAPDMDEEFEAALTHLLGRTGTAATSGE